VIPEVDRVLPVVCNRALDGRVLEQDGEYDGEQCVASGEAGIESGTARLRALGQGGAAGGAAGCNGGRTEEDTDRDRDPGH